MTLVSLHFYCSHCPFSDFNTILTFSASSLSGADFASDFTEKTEGTGWWTTWLPLFPSLQTQYLHTNHHCTIPLLTVEKDAFLCLRAVLPSFLNISSLTSQEQDPPISPYSTWIFKLFVSAFISYLTQPLSCTWLHFIDFPSTFLTPPQSLLEISISLLGNPNPSCICRWCLNPYFPPWPPWTLMDGRLSSVPGLHCLTGTFSPHWPQPITRQALAVCVPWRSRHTLTPVSQARTLSYTLFTSFAIPPMFTQTLLLWILPLKSLSNPSIHSLHPIPFKLKQPLSLIRMWAVA